MRGKCERTHFRSREVEKGWCTGKGRREKDDRWCQCWRGYQINTTQREARQRSETARDTKMGRIETFITGKGAKRSTQKNRGRYRGRWGTSLSSQASEGGEKPGQIGEEGGEKKALDG